MRREPTRYHHRSEGSVPLSCDRGGQAEDSFVQHPHADSEPGRGPPGTAARKCIDYVTNNRHRMCYSDFRAQGLCVSSGVVEAGCKTAIGTRLKRTGMHWTVTGADAIIALRCCVLSGRFENFWERRSGAAVEGVRRAA